MTRLVLSELRIGTLPPLDLVVDAEVCSLVAPPGDGLARLAEVVLGLSSASRGEVRIDGLDPRKRADVRRKIGALLKTEWPKERRTDPLDRQPDDLELQAARRAALDSALALDAPLVLALVEPLTACAERRHVVTTLAARAASGAAVLAVVASEGDAVALGGRVVCLERRGDGGVAAWAHRAPSELVVHTMDAEKLVAAIGREEGHALLHLESKRPSELVVRAVDLKAASLFVMRVAVASGVRIIALSGQSARGVAT